MLPFRAYCATCLCLRPSYALRLDEPKCAHARSVGLARSPAGRYNPGTRSGLLTWELRFPRLQGLAGLLTFGERCSAGQRRSSCPRLSVSPLSLRRGAPALAEPPLRFGETQSVSSPRTLGSPTQWRFLVSSALQSLSPCGWPSAATDCGLQTHTGVTLNSLFPSAPPLFTRRWKEVTGGCHTPRFPCSLKNSSCRSPGPRRLHQQHVHPQGLTSPRGRRQRPRGRRRARAPR